MPVEHFIQTLHEYQPLSAAYKDFLWKGVHVIYPNAKGKILPLGHHALSFFFVSIGLLYSWHCDEEGNIVPTHFIKEKQMIGTVTHPLYPTPIPDGIMSLEKSVIVTGDVAMSAEAVKRFPEARELINRTVISAQNREQKLQEIRTTHGGKARFQALEHAEPELFSRVPDHLLAAYLNLRRVQFNRIKNSVYKHR